MFVVAHDDAVAVVEVIVIVIVVVGLNTLVIVGTKKVRSFVLKCSP